MPALDYDAIKRDATLWMLLDVLAWRPSWREGRRARGPCPIHGSGSPSSRSFAVNGDDWYCHKCKFGGGALELVTRYMSLPVRDAALLLCKLVGIQPTYLPRAKRPAGPRNRKTEQ